ncbi:hypothetical protein G5I_04336 [Acromyrmex echinatior]|uniref:Uncharacterized protein n=1 Tax=Acromyrmex echinatior TaxID=103372 RepID=F4WFC9_ACREC|nr:hypothetical protein G5I_04336 [Acromyrmex echinatior]
MMVQAKCWTVHSCIPLAIQIDGSCRKARRAMKGTADDRIIERVTHLNSLPRGSLSGDVGPPRPLPAPSLREDARALDMYAAGAGGGLQGGQQTGLLPPGVERVYHYLAHHRNFQASLTLLRSEDGVFCLEHKRLSETERHNGRRIPRNYNTGTERQRLRRSRGVERT